VPRERARRGAVRRAHMDAWACRAEKKTSKHPRQASRPSRPRQRCCSCPPNFLDKVSSQRPTSPPQFRSRLLLPPNSHKMQASMVCNAKAGLSSRRPTIAFGAKAKQVRRGRPAGIGEGRGPPMADFGGCRAAMRRGSAAHGRPIWWCRCAAPPPSG
jgi:hypothetical protein